MTIDPQRVFWIAGQQARKIAGPHGLFCEFDDMRAAAILHVYRYSADDCAGRCHAYARYGAQAYAASRKGRAEATHPRFMPEAEPPLPAGVGPDPDLSMLTAAQRAAVQTVVLDGVPLARAAELLGKTSAGVRQTLQRALTRLRPLYLDRVA